MIDNVLIEFMREQLAITSTDFVRHKYSEIDWSLQMFGLVGPRGVGKTTLIKQHIIFEKERQKALYISADHSYFAQHTLAEVASSWIKEGGTHLYIDEIHKYENWSTELKNIYDGHPTLYVVRDVSQHQDAKIHIRRGHQQQSGRLYPTTPPPPFPPISA